MMNTLAGMTLAGSAVLALWLASSGILRTRLPARWHYRILKISLLFFLVPVGRVLPLAARVLSALRPVPAAIPAVSPVRTAPEIPVMLLPQAPVTAPAAPVLPPPSAPEPFSVTAEALRLLAVLWALGAAAMLAYKVFVYLRLRRRVFRQNRPVSSREAQLVFWSCKRALNVRGPVELRENPAARSPFAAGLLRPTVVIPSAGLEREELRYLFSHELTHIKCGDLWVRFFAMLAQVIHWYNPLVYLLSRSIQTVSEQSCDERVACPLSKEERYVYGNVILKLAAGAAGSGDWAASLSTRESMERRLIRVLRTEKLKGGKRLAALALALAILACGGGAALAARNPLPVGKEEKAPARTVAVLPGEEGTKGGESTVKPAVPAVTPREDEVKQPEESKPDKPVTTNGTPSEAFLKELREHFGVPADTPVLFGDHALIVSRGGTLLPDEDFDSYTCVSGGSDSLSPVIYKEFYTKNSGFDPRGNAHANVCLSEYDVGKPEALEACNQFISSTLYNLVNGEYPKNSRGESYGSQSLQWYVGYAPDLQYVAEYLPERRPAGYTRAADYRIPDHTAEECKKEYPIPLYNPEGQVIGQYLLDCGGRHIDTTGMSIEDVKAALAAGASTTEEARAAAAEAAAGNQDAGESWLRREEVRGDLDLIRSRGGTLLPEGDGLSYLISPGDSQHVYRRYRDRDGVLRREDRVGNKDALSEEARALLNTLVKGEYPKNARGETYGYECLADYVGYAPDLAVWVEGPEQGYWRQKELEDQADALHFACKCPGEFRIPLYASDGKTVKTHVTYICPYSVHLE